MTKVEPAFSMDGASIEGSFNAMSALFGVQDPNDWTRISVRGAQIEEFDVSGKKLTLQFFEGAKFGKLTADEKTILYDDEGEKLGVAAVEQDGQFQVLALGQSYS
jgi:hypothetical protein